jgi:hypothetical protein
MGLIRLRAELRAIRDAIDELRHAIKQHSETIHTAQEAEERSRRSRQPVPVVIALDDKTARDAQAEYDRQYRTQQSIRNWARGGVFAAIIYAAIAVFQWGEMRTQTKQVAKQFEAQQRPWISGGEIEFKQPEFLVYPDNPMPAKTQVNVTVEIPTKNFGVAPAFHVDVELSGTMTKQIAGPQTMDTMMELACHLADGNSKQGGGALFPNSTPTKFEIPVALGVPFIEVTEVRRVWITICIAYSSNGSTERLHHTKIWAASWPIDGQPTEIRRSTRPKVIYYTLPITQWGVVKTEAD